MSSIFPAAVIAFFGPSLMICCPWYWTVCPNFTWWNGAVLVWGLDRELCFIQFLCCVLWLAPLAATDMTRQESFFSSLWIDSRLLCFDMNHGQGIRFRFGDLQPLTDRVR